MVKSVEPSAKAAWRSTNTPTPSDRWMVTLNMMELSDDAAERIIASNQSLNTIYASNDLDDEQDFIPVIDAIQGDGFNPLWEQILTSFTSDEEILEAAAGGNPEITLVDTDEVYRCSVVGH